MVRIRFLFLVIALLLVLPILFVAQRRDAGPESIRRGRLIMGTVVEITAFGEDRTYLETAIDEAFRSMERIENLMSAHRPRSDISRLNAAAEPIEVAPETAAVLTLGLRVAQASGGAFDMSLGRLVELWGIEGSNPRIPTEGEIAKALEGIGPQALSVQGRKVRKRSPSLHIDLGAIAKGFAVDQAIEVLRRAGVVQASINAGGDLRLLGDHQGRPWRIGIQHPRRTQAILASLELKDLAVVTSGDYERFFERDGVRYHHLFDPHTGYPANRCQSVTVIAGSAAEADALATATFVLGPEAGLRLIESWPGTQALLVAADGSMTVSDALKDRVRWP